MSISQAFTTILQTFCVISVFLLIGTFLRAKVPVFQNLYLPACVIGGFLGLILGPNGFNLIPIPEDMMSVASSTPGILITPVLAAVPMCVQPVAKGTFKKQKDLVVLTFLALFISMFQFFTGLAVNVGFTFTGFDTYPSLGLELATGFMGGHGMAGTLGNTLNGMEVSYWETAQGMASTTATVGLIGGLIVGITLINLAARKGYTTRIKSAQKASLAERVGFFAMGPMSLEPVTRTDSVHTINITD